MEPIDSIGVRLREVREKMGKNQTDFAALAGSTRQTQSNYEKGERMPDALYLAAIAAAGADVAYILTGQPTAPGVKEERPDYPATPRAQALMDNYKECSEEDQKAIERMALLAAAAKQQEPPPVKGDRRSGQERRVKKDRRVA